MNRFREKERMLATKQERLAAYIVAHPQALDELFRFTDEEVRHAAMVDIKLLDLRAATLLCDRIVYLERTRIVHQRNDMPRCRGKVIYDQRGAQAKAKRIWDQGRGRMRVYHCPYCQGYHLTHTAHRDDDRQVA